MGLLVGMRGIETFHEEPHYFPAMARQVIGNFRVLAICLKNPLRSFQGDFGEEGY